MHHSAGRTNEKDTPVRTNPDATSFVFNPLTWLGCEFYLTLNYANNLVVNFSLAPDTKAVDSRGEEWNNQNLILL